MKSDDDKGPQKSKEATVTLSAQDGPGGSGVAATTHFYSSGSGGSCRSPMNSIRVWSVSTKPIEW